jgi:hypothetical protein
MSSQMRGIVLLLGLLILSGCTAVGAPASHQGQGSGAAVVVATATLHPLFLRETSSGGLDHTAVAGVGSDGSDHGGASPAGPTALGQPQPGTTSGNPPARATITPLPTRAATATPRPLTTVTIYDEELRPGWSLRHSDAMSWRLLNSDPAYSGEVSIVITPLADYGMLFFTVEANSAAPYPRAQVRGLSFWLFSPDEPLGLDELSVSILGSNIYPYWIKGDNSVENESWPVFSETRLEFLGFNFPIPPNEWTRVEVWLEDLLYDPDYEYVTGFYIKNDEGFYRTVYIDQVEMILDEAE